MLEAFSDLTLVLSLWKTNLNFTNKAISSVWKNWK